MLCYKKLCTLFGMYAIKGQNIFENHLQKNNALAKSLTKLKMNQKGNQSSGRKYRDNIPQLEPTMLCCVCKTEQRKGYPGKFCCDKLVHNKCKKKSQMLNLLFFRYFFCFKHK